MKHIEAFDHDHGYLMKVFSNYLAMLETELMNLVMASSYSDGRGKRSRESIH